jgi:hypothetical protein
MCADADGLQEPLPEAMGCEGIHLPSNAKYNGKMYQNH